MPIEAQVFVAEAAGDLEIAVEPRDHEQLLVDLRRLRQRVTLARVHARRDEIVARALGCRLGEDRRFDLQEVELAECAPRSLQQPVAQDQVGLQLGPPQVEVAMLEAQLLSRQFFGLPARHRNCGRLGRAGDAQQRGVHLDLAGRELGVAHRRRASHDLAFDEQHRFRAHGLRAGHDFRRGPSRADRDLHESVAIPEIEKHDPSKVAAAMDPAP